MSEGEFNLLDEKWILAIDDDGNMSSYSLKGIFSNAHLLRRLSGEIATQDIAVLRVLLAVLYAVYQKHNADGEESLIESSDDAFRLWENLWNRGAFDEKLIHEYLEFYRDRFYLFHPKRPFFQAPISIGTEYDASKLNGELSESNNKPRFFSSINGFEKNSMDYAEATRWLINLNGYDDTSSKPKGKNLPSAGAGWLGKMGLVYTEGRNLFETLMLNFVLLSENDEPFPIGIPAWEPLEAECGERINKSLPASPVEILTLQCRRIMLTRTEGRVTGYILLGGDIVSKENAFTEQMTIWYQNKDGNYVPRRHDPSRSIWRDYQSLLVKSMEDNSCRLPGVVRWAKDLMDEGLIEYDSITFSVVGAVFADKDFFINDFSSDTITVNKGLLSTMNETWNYRIANIVSITDRMVSQIWRYASNIAAICGCDENACKASGGKAKTRAYFDLDYPFREWLRSINPSIDDNIDNKMVEWLDTAFNILKEDAKTILENSDERAIIGKDGESVFSCYNMFISKLYKIKKGDDAVE